MSIETSALLDTPKKTPIRESGVTGINHFDLLGDLPRDEKGLISLNTEVSIDYQGQVETMLFSDYLRFCGATYLEYRQAVKERPEESINRVLRDLHRKIVRADLLTAEKLGKQYTHESATDTNYQVETTRDHGQIFDRIINDLGIDGLSSESAPANVDYSRKVGIDHFLSFSPQELLVSQQEDGAVKTSDELQQNFFIGIQRSFSSAKKRGILKDPVKILPSDNSKGVVFKIFLQEHLFEYEDDNHDTLMEKLDALRREAARKAGMSPDEYARKRPRQGYPGVHKVLRNGQVEQIKRTLRVLEEIKLQLNNYIASPEFQAQSDFIKKSLENMRDNLHLDDYIAAVQMVDDAK